MNIHIHLENFKGQGEDPNKWFTHFERWAAFMDMNGDRAAMALPFYLRGIAKTWFDSLSEATQVNLNFLGQVWYLIVSIPDLCNLTYFT